MVARLRTEPSNPADAQDDAEQADVDAELKTIAERQPAAFESRSCRSIAQPGSRAQQTNVTKPRKGKVVASDRGITVLPDWVVSEVKNNSYYAVRPLNKNGIRRGLFAATRTDCLEKPFMRNLIDLASQEAGRLQKV